MSKPTPGKDNDSSSSSGPRQHLWIWETLKSLKVEPAGFLFFVSVILTFLAYQNRMLEIACKEDLGYDEEVCIETIRHLNSSFKNEEREIQQVASGVRAIQSLITSLFNIFVVLLLGAVSDRKGRKITMLIPLGGWIGFCLLVLGSNYLLTLVSIPTLVVAIVVSIPYCTTGGLPVFFMSAFSYIADSTSDEDRTIRTGIMSAVTSCGGPVAFAVAGVLTTAGLKDDHFVALALGLCVLSFLTVLWRVESWTPEEMRRQFRIRNGGTDAENHEGFLKKDEDVPKEKIQCNPFKLMWQTFSVLLQNRKNRGDFYLLILCYLCFILPGPGEFTLIYLFVRERLGWGVGEYGLFSTCTMIMGTLGTILTMFILSKVLRVRDAWIGLLGCISQILGSITYAFAADGKTMFIAAALDMLNGTMGIVVKSMLSKTVEPEEIGKMFSLLALLDTIMPVISGPGYALLYGQTVGVFTGSIFMASAVITVPALIVFMYFVCKSPRLQDKKLHKEGDQEGVEVIQMTKS